MRKNRAYIGVGAFLFLLVGALIGLKLNNNDNPHDVLAAGTACPSSMQITQPVTSTALIGITPIKFVGTTDIVQVKFILNGAVIGRGSQDTINPGTWFMGWDTAFAPNSTTHELYGNVKFADNQQCNTTPVFIGTNNPTQKSLTGNINPPEWTGFTNSVALFNIDFTSPTTADIPRYADVTWAISGTGTVIPELNAQAHYNSGPSSGDGTVKAIINYGGKSLQLQSPVHVVTQSTSEGGGGGGGSNTTTTTTTTSGGSTTSGEDTTTTNDSSGSGSGSTDNTTTTNTVQYSPPKEAITQVVESDSATKTCFVEKLGEDNFNKLLEENRRPVSSEFQTFYSCFSRQRYVVPSILAPVAPEEVVQKKESRKVMISRINNDKIIHDEDNSEKTVLVLSGTTDPNAPVILYVFSEPLVLATTADSDGNWTYTLEDPLAGGQHEVYALVDRGDGEYERSSVASFFIGTAEASESNPNGYSLELLSEPTISASNRSVNLYIAATIGIVTFVGTIVIAFGLRKVWPSKDDPTNMQPPPPNNLITPV